MAPFAKKQKQQQKTSSTINNGVAVVNGAMESTSSFVAIVLDITGSMGNQIQGVKDAIRELIPILAENPLLGIVIITFTEVGEGCYVSVDIFSDPGAAHEFVSNITLSRSPRSPSISANGEDGNENSKAGLYALTELDGSQPTVVFFITDAGYHPRAQDSSTAQAEEDYLADKGVQDTDFFALFDSVLAHFSGNLVVVPVVYSFGSLPGCVVQAYGQVAMTSGSGVVIEPVRYTSQTLALTMGTFVRRLLGQLNGQRDLPPAPPQEMLAGLRLFDVSDMTRVSRQSNAIGPRPSVGDGERLFDSAMTRAVTAFKVAWKRCIDVNKVSLLRQLLFGLDAAKLVLATTSGNPIAEDLMSRLKTSFPALLEAMPEDQKRHIKATPEVIEAMARDLAADWSGSREGEGKREGAIKEASDSVSLETVRDTLELALEEELRDDEEDVEGTGESASSEVDPLGMVCGMVHGVFINVRFPPGPDGKPNFSDSWSAMIDKHSFDIVSAGSAVRMFKDGDREPWEGDDTSSTVVGLTDRRKYNGFVPLMDEEDPLKTAVLRILSGLQVMNLIQMTVLAGSPEGFLPNMYPGVFSATLARVIRTSAGGSWAGAESSEANYRLASHMLFSLQNIMGKPAAVERRRLEEGKADPANPVSKFLMVLSRQSRKSKEEEKLFQGKMRLVLDEWVATTVQQYFGKATPENDDKFHAFLKDIVPLESIFGEAARNIDPLEMLHPLERMGEKDGAGVIPLSTWEEAGLTRLSKTPLYKDLRRLVDRCKVVFKCPDMEYRLDDIVLKYIVYRFRTARYDFVESPASTSEKTSASGVDDVMVGSGSSRSSAKGTHEPIEEMPSTLGLLMNIYKKALASELTAIKETRRLHVMNLLKTRVVKARSITSETRSMQLLGSTYSLGRTDVPALLEAAGYGDLGFVEQLVIGDWTPEPPQCLRRFAVDILSGVDAAGGDGEGDLSERFREAIAAQEVCLRKDRCNRHGHTVTVPYPGPMGWTQEYQASRNANLAESGRGNARILPQMKRFTDFGAEVLKRLEGGVRGRPDRLTKVDIVDRAGADGQTGEYNMGGANAMGSEAKREAGRVLYSFNDANQLPKAKKLIEALRVPGVLDGL